MSFIPATYANLKDRFPAQVQEVVDEVMRSRSNLKKQVPENWEWGFSWATQVDGISPGFGLSPNPPKTTELVCLQVKNYFSSMLGVIPQEIIDAQKPPKFYSDFKPGSLVYLFFRPAHAGVVLENKGPRPGGFGDLLVVKWLNGDLEAIPSNSVNDFEVLLRETQHKLETHLKTLKKLKELPLE